MRLNFILGTAAELIKVYPLIQKARERGDDVYIISTGQSRENFMMQYRDFNLPPEILIPMLPKSEDLKNVIAAMKWFVRALCITSGRIRRMLFSGLKVEKNFVVVHGDTLSSLVGAILGRRAALPVVHIEAGLRSPNLWQPFPEEITRRIVSRLATHHMAPDQQAADNLLRSNVCGRIVNTEGNTLKDAVLLKTSTSETSTKPFVLVNIHRFENLNSGERWPLILETLIKVSKKFPMIFIAHPQTRYKLSIDRHASAEFQKNNIEIRDRLPFSQFMALLHQADFLISDGGSNQEECSYLGKPCLLLREETERQEGLGANCVLSQFDQSKIDHFIANPKMYERPPETFKGRSPSEIILKELAESP